MGGDVGSGSTATRELDQTPTWAVAGVCAAIILISILLEMFLHKIGSWLLKKHKNALFEALEKVKAELMILGFISLLLTFFQRFIIKICVPEMLADTMLPCPWSGGGGGGGGDEGEESSEEEHRRKLLWYYHPSRFLSDAVSSASTCKAGHEPILSINGLHQLHILIFFLAVFHIINSVITMTLGRLKTRGWKEWEHETLSHAYEFSNDRARFRLTHETSFVKLHTSFWTRIPFFFYVGCFFRQFFRSVTKADYLTLRNGFITVHLAPGSKFNFQKYIKRSLEDDFKVVVGVSPILWTSFVIFLLLNVSGWRALFWASLIPLLVILAVGTKLQAILTKMALEITERHAVVQGIPLVQGSDKYFWFGRPKLVLHLIHFTLFQNAFQITYFLWIWYSFGLNSCFHENLNVVLVKVALGVGVLCLSSYITLPLYALITQMGSNLKRSIFDEQTCKALKKWQMAAKKKQGGRAISHTETLGASPAEAHQSSSSGHTLHRFKTTGHSTRSFTAYGGEEQEMSEFEAEPLSPTLPTANLISSAIEEGNPNHPGGAAGQGNKDIVVVDDEFSFDKPPVVLKGP